jgi:hypothetical protein
MKQTTQITTLLFAALTLAPLCWGSGHETGNGGTVIVDGQTYYLSDLEFTALPSKQITLDDDLIAAINSDAAAINTVLLSSPTTINFMSFFSNTVLNPLNEYRFVSTLPSLCPPVATPAGVQVGCAQGSLTFIIPKVFTSLTLEEKAELLIEIRLEAFNALLPSQLDLVLSAFKSALSTYKSSSEGGSTILWLSDDDLTTLNLFARTFAPKNPSIIVQGGGRIRLDQATLSIDLKGLLLDMNSSIELLGTSFHANHVELVHSLITTTDFSGDQVLMINSTITLGEVHLSGANIQESTVYAPTNYSGQPVPGKPGVMDVQNFTSRNAVVSQLALLQGSSITLNKISSDGYYATFGGEIKGNDVTLCNISLRGNYDGDHQKQGDCNASNQN